LDRLPSGAEWQRRYPEPVWPRVVKGRRFPGGADVYGPA
jgi:hypothetical protein